jgi:hypothetical protein
VVIQVKDPRDGVAAVGTTAPQATLDQYLIPDASTGPSAVHIGFIDSQGYGPNYALYVSYFGTNI